MTSKPVSDITFGRVAPGVLVRDLQRACAFYCDVLGFEKTFQNGDPVGFVILEKDKAELHLSLVRDHKPSTTNVAHLLVDDVDALHEMVGVKKELELLHTTGIGAAGQWDPMPPVGVRPLALRTSGLKAPAACSADWYLLVSEPSGLRMLLKSLDA